MKSSKCTGHDLNAGATRRGFLNSFGMGLGGLALADLWGTDSTAHGAGTIKKLHVPPKAKRVIFLFQSGGPSQMDLFDYKPKLNELHGKQLPDSVRMGQRLTGMSASQSNLPLAGSPFKFKQHGESGAWVSDLLPHTSKIVDDLCFVKSMFTEAINHGPAVTYVQTGSQFPGRPSMGAWLSYGLGSETKDLPAFVVLVTKNKGGQPLVSRLWGNGFLPAKYQGVRLRSGKDPVLYLSNPSGIDAAARNDLLGGLRELHEISNEKLDDPAIDDRIAQNELAFRMQKSIPEVADFSNEPASVLKQYGEAAKNPGSFPANCLMARRLAERGVRFIQLYHPGWDQHGGLAGGIKRQCNETDQACAALVSDLKQRGMLDDTLVIWGGEFGRTNYCQGKLTKNSFGRDHHPRCFTMWMAGGGVKAGASYGETCEFGYNLLSDPVHIHDLQATILHQLGIDHERLTFRYQGRRFRLTDVHGELVKGIIA